MKKLQSDGTIFVVSPDKLSEEEADAVRITAGIINRQGCNLYLRKSRADRRFFDYVREPGKWLEGRPTRAISGLDELLGLLPAGTLTGVVVYDRKIPDTANLAFTLCGLRNAIAVPYVATRHPEYEGSLYKKLVIDRRAPVVESFVKSDGTSKFADRVQAYEWLLNYLKKNRNSLQPNLHALVWNRVVDGGGGPSDWVISLRGLHFDLSFRTADKAESDLLKALLDPDMMRANSGMRLMMGYPPVEEYMKPGDGKEATVEWKAFTFLSERNIGKVPSVANGSFFRHLTLNTLPKASRVALQNVVAQVQAPLTRERLRERGLLDAKFRPVPSVLFVAFSSGDWDSSLILLSKPGAISTLWEGYSGTSQRTAGNVPVGICLSPSILDVMPCLFSFMYENALGTSWRFMGGTSGPAYVIPRAFGNLKILEDYATSVYRGSGISTTSFVVEGNQGQAMTKREKVVYARFSPGGVGTQWPNSEGAVNGVPFLQVRDKYLEGQASNESDKFVQLILEERKSNPTQRYFLFRTTYWSALTHKALVDAVAVGKLDKPADPKKGLPAFQGKKVVFVDPETLFALMKLGR